jgi:hypothetical protein
MYTVSSRPMTKEERAKVLDLQIELKSTFISILYLFFLWVIIIGLMCMLLKHANLLIFGIPLAQLKPTHTNSAALVLGILTWAGIVIYRMIKAKKAANDVVEVLNIEARAVVAVDMGECNPEQPADVTYDPNSILYWYFFDIGDDQLLCLGPVYTVMLEDEGAKPFPTSRLQIVRLPNTRHVISASSAGDLLQPIRCRSSFIKGEYQPNDDCCEMIPGTLETLDEDLVRLKAHPK